MIFGGPKPIEDKLDKGTFFGPNILKMTLCLSPVLLLLLLSTGTDSMRYREEIWMVSLRIALDLFDGVEMLEIILEENELCHGVPKEFEKGIIAVVCIGFLLSIATVGNQVKRFRRAHIGHTNDHPDHLRYWRIPGTALDSVCKVWERSFHFHC